MSNQIITNSFMNNIQDPLFIVPHLVQPTYRQQDALFIFSVTINNQHPHPLHFYIVSTLGCCLTQTTHKTKINPNSTLTLCFKVKPTNLVGGGIQTMTIFTSKDPIIQLFPLDHCLNKQIRLKFNQDTKMDPSILQILENELDNCLSSAEEYKLKGNLDQSMSKCQQAYQINRFSHKAIQAMINTRILQKDFAGAIHDIASAEISNPNNTHLKYNKLKLIVEWQKPILFQNQELFYYVKTTLDFFKKNHHALNVQELKFIQEINQQFKKCSKNSQRNRSSNFVYNFMKEKALQKYSQYLPISQYYSREELQEELKDLFLNEQQEDNSSPEEIIDPINYQIMKKPFILPSGTSYQESSLKAYFNSNGYKDPISRKPVNPNFIFPNFSFQKYIRTHPKLKKWQKYEHDLLNN